MALINLSNDEILSLNSQIEAIDLTLINRGFPEMKDIINRIRNNVKNDQIAQILNDITTQVDAISGNLSAELPKLEEFLNNQMEQYAVSEAEAEAKVNAVLQKMTGFSEKYSVEVRKEPGTPAASGQGTPNPKSEYKYESQTKETWTSWWDDVKYAYSDTNSVWSFIGNTAQALIYTDLALLETPVNIYSDVGHFFARIFG